MIKEQLVTFETAKLAKQRGFPIDIHDIEYYTESGTIYPGKNNTTFSQPKYPAPSQSLLQKWLRDIHEINLWMATWGPENQFYHVEDITVGLGMDMVVVITGGTGSTNYEEALEEGLYRALENLDF